MTIAVVGLGLIGGSYAKAIKKYTDHFVIGINRTRSTLEKALSDHAIDKIGDENDLKNADIIILSMYPALCIEYIEKYGEYIKKDCIVTDASGIKSAICPKLSKLSEKFGFTFIGSHPMAGKEKNGYDVSASDLFNNASFIVTPLSAEKEKVKILTDLALSIGFGRITYTDPYEHDRMIAFTSQLPHVLACSYVLSPCCPNHNGFSAGSYRDVSRVANINSKLWSELFLENREPLIQELDILIDNITSIINAIKDEDRDRLIDLLEQGHMIKKQLGE